MQQATMVKDFNYFARIEERFNHRRGGPVRLLSAIDWALIEDWKESSVPLGPCSKASMTPSVLMASFRQGQRR